MSSYSVFIPRIFSNISADHISHIFRYRNIGETEKIDLIKRTNSDGKTYNMAFIHIAILYDTPEAKSFCRDVEDPSVKAKLVYNDPWYWIVLPFDKNLHQHCHSNFQVQMVPFYVMTPHGPMWQWGFPAMPAPIHTTPLIPPQVMYGKLKHKSYNKPRIRINVPKMNTDTTDTEISLINSSLESEKEEGEV